MDFSSFVSSLVPLSLLAESSGEYYPDLLLPVCIH